uniref:CCHC-type domain-containing protein n=1 Tax=Ananas comosus var. bracteatus TaxID=296719 RepID=A0A6V7Q3E7_ANACO|nr:unnamed protein product [Ananas comosus var. bracteatus]
MEYFPESNKWKIKDDFRKLRQGSRSVREYEKEFSHMRGNAIAREERDAFEKNKDREKSKKRAASGSAGQLSSKRPPRYQRPSWRGGRSQTQSQTSFPCVICGGDQKVVGCPQREGRCFRCGQVRHMSRECPGGASPAPSATSVQYAPRQFAGLPPVMSVGRSSAPQQPEVSRAAPSGRVYAAQAKEPAVPSDVVVSIILIKGIRARSLFDTGASNSFIGMSFAKSHDS